LFREEAILRQALALTMMLKMALKKKPLLEQKMLRPAEPRQLEHLLFEFCLLRLNLECALNQRRFRMQVCEQLELHKHRLSRLPGLLALQQLALQQLALQRLVPQQLALQRLVG
jgi:hypothetical protein